MTRFVDNYLAALLAQASHLISSEFHAVVRANGLSVLEWRVLASLAGGEPIAIGQLAQVAVLKQPTVTRMLDRMAAKRQVERLIGLAREHEQRVLEPFGLARAEDLKTTLRQIIELHRTAGSGEV